MLNKLIALAVIVLLLVGLVVFGVYHNKTVTQKDDLIRQLNGQLTAKEAAFEAANNSLGLAQSKIVSQDALKAQYNSLINGKDADLGKLNAALTDLQAKYKARVDSITTAHLHLHETATSGGTVTVTETPSQGAKAGGKSNGTGIGEPAVQGDSEKVISYEYWDKYKRFHLFDPNIHLAGDETFTVVNQNFALRGIVLRQNNGNLKTQQVVLQEVVSDGKGGWTSLGAANVTDAQFTYAPDPAVAAKGNQFWDPHLFAEVGASLKVAPPVTAAFNLGVGASLLKLWDFGLSVDGYTDFKTFEGTGLAAQAFWRPSIKDRPFNLAIAAGAGLGLDLAVHPYVGIQFIIL